MKKIIILGDSGSKAVTKAVIRVCTAYGGAFVIDDDRIYETSEEPQFLVLTSDGGKEILCGDTVILGSSAETVNIDRIRTDQAVMVIDSGNKKLLAKLKNRRIAAIGCSMSAQDTLSISCSGFPVKMVSLQRNIAISGGHTAEPQEFTVRLSEETEVYPLLAACAVLLMSGISSDEGYYF